MLAILVYISLALFFLGLSYKAFHWFTKKLGYIGRSASITQRVRSAAGGLLRVLFSAGLFLVLKAILLDVLLQSRIFKEGFLRWLSHMLIFYGFMMLLLMHALHSQITEVWFNDYYPTVNPFWFLRDLCGAMVLTGVALAVVRRFLIAPARLRTGGRDHYAIAILTVIMLSGIGLEGLKMSSHSEFRRMVEDYAGLDDAQEIEALEAFWVKEYGLAAPDVAGPFDEDLLDAGREVHESNCLDCHASAKWAFTGYAAARIIGPAAIRLDRAGGVTIFWYLHVIACLAGLAYLPFSKMFHIIAAPISLIANRVIDPRHSAPANILTRQIMELDACTHCGSCSISCSAGMIYEALGNEYILPSEKMTFLQKMISGRKADSEQYRAVSQGVYLCTNCDRCTVRCPSGIRLKELWVNAREDLLASGPPLVSVLTPFSFARGIVLRERLYAAEYIAPIEKAAGQVACRSEEFLKSETALPLTGDVSPPQKGWHGDATFSHCFSCQTCTTVCPVVANYEEPEEMLGLLPHQIMCSLGLGLAEMAGKAKMIWDCLTCYQCQENCPQQVAVCDLLYDLKNAVAAEN